MEETNFRRAPQLAIDPVEITSTETAPAHQGDPEKPAVAASASHSPAPSTRAGTAPMRARSSSKTLVQKWALVRRADLQQPNKLKGMVLRPLVFLTFPVIFTTGFMYGAMLCYFNVLNGTTSLILSAAPYNFSSSMVGLTYVACLLGISVGSYYSGPLGDQFVLWKARRNQGLREPEYRLWLYASLCVLCPGGLLLWGVGAAHGVHWFGLVFAMFLLGACIAVGCQLPISYCIDCYKDLGADAIVTVILVRNSMSFAIGYGYVAVTLLDSVSCTESLLDDK